jgi:PAS domain S-box-containing protein
MIAWSNTVLRSQAGNITGVTSIGEDITDKKNAEIALIKEKNWSQAIIAAIGDGISIQDRDFRVIYQNQVDKDLHGDHIGQFCYEAYEYQDKTCDGCAVAASFKDGMIHTTERTVQTGQGTLHVEITTSPLKDETGRIIAGIEAVRNITGRKQVENSLRDRNAFIEAITNNLPIGLAVNRVSDGNVIYMNSAFEEIYGWPKDLLSDVERFFTHVYPDPDFRKEIKEKILSDIAGGDPSRMQWDNVPIATQAGETKFVAAVNIPLFEQGLMISTVMDITARRQAEQALIESEQRYKRLVRSVTDYIVTIDVENGRAVATYHGPGCLNVTGYASNEYQADPDLWYRMIFDGDRNTVIEQTNAVLSGAPAAPFEHRIIHKDGSLRWVRHTPVPRAGGDGRVITVDSLITDITQLKLLESQLRQAQKMEAIGQLAGGIAHDFNNILTAIIGYSHLLLMKMDEGNPDRPYVEHIIASSERAAHLTQSLLAFSRKQIIDLKPVNLNDIIRRTDHLLERVIGEDIEFKTTLAEEGLPVMADSMHIEQVLMNLAANARDAMPNGGMLRLETGVASIGEDFIRTHSYGRPGTYAFLSITDTGSGMDENIRRRIFEPFFTTKEVGKGTGLGLSMVYGIVKQHHGYIDVYSEPGQGTTFKVYLPMLAAAAVEKPTPAPVGIARGTETVLLAEDDKTVRDLARHVLENSGYQVIEASDGEEAVAKFFDAGKHIDLLVFDIIMPKKNGKEAYLEIMKIRPDIKALFMSGYTADMVHNKGLLEINLDFVRKPISPTDLLKKVREILDRKS